MSDFYHSVTDDGFAVVQTAFSGNTILRLSECLADPSLQRSRAGIRHALGVKTIANFAKSDELIEMAREILGPNATPFRATLFDKSPVSNWLVVWHQDTALPLRIQQDMPGWGPWSLKDGVHYAHAPANALEKVLALRVHLDNSLAENGPLRLLPGTHKLGVLTDEQLHAAAEKVTAIDCLIQKGGVLAMRPLIVHASSKSTIEIPRRVLHIEYASSRFIAHNMELATA